MSKAISKDKKLKYIAAGLGAVLIVSALLLVISLWERGQGTFDGESGAESVFTHEGVEYAPKSGVETFLVMGLDSFDGEGDKGGYSNDRQADFLMLLVFDNESRTTAAVHINRDTLVDVNLLGVAGNTISTERKQIALAYNEGNGREVSCRNTADSVSSLLCGIKVNHYVSLTMDSVAVFNDLVGGVELEIMDDFTGIDDSLVKGQTLRLSGEQALTYVRSRQGLEDSSNSTRMVRQQQYLNALYNSTVAKLAEDEQFVASAALRMGEYIVSDRSVTQLEDILRRFSDYEFTGIRSIAGETVMGEQFYEFHADETAVRSLVAELFYVAK